MLLSANFGISWKTFPNQGASVPDQIAAQLNVCATATSELDSIANQNLRATVNTEQQFGPDWVITVDRNGWTRFRTASWPILQVLGAQYSVAGVSTPDWNAIPTDTLLLEPSGLPVTGDIIPGGASGPATVLIAPGYVGWGNGRRGYLIQLTDITGFPVAGIDQTATAGATTVHVDDITGWWNGTGGATGTIQDPPWREVVTVAGATPDVVGAISGPGRLALTAGLRFLHQPRIGLSTEPDQPVLLSTMPETLIMAAHYMAIYYGQIRGATAAVMQVSRAQLQGTGGGAQDWYTRSEAIAKRFARVI